MFEIQASTPSNVKYVYYTDLTGDLSDLDRLMASDLYSSRNLFVLRLWYKWLHPLSWVRDQWQCCYDSLSLVPSRSKASTTWVRMRVLGK